MKSVLLGGSALLGVGFAVATGAGGAAAAEPIKLTVGGFFREAYMVVLDDDDEHLGATPSFIEAGNERSTDGFFNDAEIHFTGRTVLDNGLEVGARVELEGETDSDQIDEAWVYFAGGWGEIRIGSEDDALANACVVPPGGTTNFSAFSPNQWGANAFNAVSNSICTGVDDVSDAQKILYITPVFYGFQLTLSYTPNPKAEVHDTPFAKFLAGPHTGMPTKITGESNYDASAYLTYSYTGRGWGVTWGGGASFEGEIDDINSPGSRTDFDEREFYQTALNFDIGRFSVGGAFEYYNDIETRFDSFGPLFIRDDHDAWVAGGGVAYLWNAWTFGAQYSYRKDTAKHDDNFFLGRTKEERVQQRAVVTVDYVLGPGIDLDAEIGYTWRDEDPESTDFARDDDYDGVEFGIGTALRF